MTENLTDAEYLSALSASIDEVRAELIVAGLGFRRSTERADVVAYVRAVWPSLVTEEIREGVTSLDWLSVIEATDDDIAAALAL